MPRADGWTGLTGRSHGAQNTLTDVSSLEGSLASSKAGQSPTEASIEIGLAPTFTILGPSLAILLEVSLQTALLGAPASGKHTSVQDRHPELRPQCQVAVSLRVDPCTGWTRRPPEGDGWPGPTCRSPHGDGFLSGLILSIPWNPAHPVMVAAAHGARCPRGSCGAGSLCPAALDAAQVS